MRSIRAPLRYVREKSKGVTVTPFEKLDLSLHSGNEVTGQVEYAEKDTKYVLRTYFAEKEGGADYLIDEQINVQTPTAFPSTISPQRYARAHAASTTSLRS